jgi:hypothetical protein
MNVCELTIAVSPPHRSRTGTVGWGAWRMLWRVRKRSRPSSPSQLWVAGPLSPYNVIIYLFIYLFCIELLLYSKDVTFNHVPWFIICVRLSPSTPGDYVRVWVLVPLKSGCDSTPAQHRPRLICNVSLAVHTSWWANSTSNAPDTTFASVKEFWLPWLFAGCSTTKLCHVVVASYLSHLGAFVHRISKTACEISTRRKGEGAHRHMGVSLFEWLHHVYFW